MSDIDLTEATKAAHKALAARWMTVASALAEDEDYPQILTDVLHAALPDVVRQAKAEAWDEGRAAGADMGISIGERIVGTRSDWPTVPKNPYRAERIEPRSEDDD